jgi:putative endonuclease
MINNLPRRLKEHKLGKTKTTKAMSELAVVYEETHNTFGTARERELYLKSAAGRRFLKNKIGNTPR